jgi:hypothetical protein
MCGAFGNHSGVLRVKKSENADSHALWACIPCGVVPITQHRTVRRKKSQPSHQNQALSSNTRSGNRYHNLLFKTHLKSA